MLKPLSHRSDFTTEQDFFWKLAILNKAGSLGFWLLWMMILQKWNILNLQEKQDEFNPEKEELLEEFLSQEIINLTRESYELKSRRTRLRAFLIPGSVLSLLIIAVISDIITYRYERYGYKISYIQYIADRHFGWPYPVAQTVSFWWLFGVVAFTFSHFWLDEPIRNIENKLKQAKLLYEEQRMKTSQGRWEFLYSELRQLNKDSARVFVFSEDWERTKLASDYRKEASNLLEKGSASPTLNEVQYLLHALREVIERERKERRNAFHCHSLVGYNLGSIRKPVSNSLSLL